MAVQGETLLSFELEKAAGRNSFAFHPVSNTQILRLSFARVEFGVEQSQPGFQIVVVHY